MASHSSSRSSSDSASDAQRESRSKRRHEQMSSELNAVETVEKGKIKVDDTTDIKKQFERVWSPGDEVMLLKGLKKYRKEKDIRSIDMKYFINFVQDSFEEKLQNQLTVKSLSSKISRMKDKFHNHEAKRQALKPGKQFVISNLHEKLLYDLSKQVWGGSTDVWGAESSNPKTILDAKVVNNQDIMSSKSADVQKGEQYPFLDMNISKSLPYLQRKMSEFISNSKAGELDNKWKEIVIKEVTIECEKAELVKECLWLLLDKKV